MQMNLWEKEKHRLIEALTARVLKGRSQITCREILKRDYPEIFKAYVKKGAEKIFLTERPIRYIKVDRYAIEPELIDNKLVLLKNFFVQRTILSAQEIQGFAKQAISFWYDLLVRPRQSLETLLFSERKIHKVEDIIAILNGADGGRPFVKNVIQMVHNLDSRSIEIEEFEKLAKRAEHNVYRQNPISTFLTEVQLLTEFEETITTRNPGVHSRVLLAMLLERGLDQMAEGLKEEATTKEFWSISEIESSLERHLVVGGLEGTGSLANEKLNDVLEAFEPAGIGSEDDVSGEEYDIITNQVGDEFSFMGQSEEEPKVLHFQFADDDSKSNAASEHESRSPEPPLSEDRRFDFDDDDDNLIIRRADIESQPPGPYPPLRSLINDKDKKLFVKKIFHKDVHEYAQFIDRLEDVEKWKEAKVVLDSELGRRRVSPYSKEAVLLGDVVFSRYFSKRKK